jgi:hypothetical protein
MIHLVPAADGERAILPAHLTALMILLFWGWRSALIIAVHSVAAIHPAPHPLLSATIVN